jgi:methylenetetrahydrofolate dehydrogenase (NADP+)/methenyltetrahydrofolate cyclohydrolase
MADMENTIIDGKEIAGKVLARLRALPKPEKFMAAVLVGNDKSSISFLAQKEKTAKLLGLDFRLYTFPGSTKNDELREAVGKIAMHKTCGGVIVQLPLPAHINRHYILNAIPQEKDVDVLSERAIGAFYSDRSKVVPPAVGVVEEVLKSLDGQIPPLQRQAVAVVGLGLLVGRPIATWIMHRAKETMLIHSGSDFALLAKADLVIAGVGSRGLINASMIKPGAGIIDFGYDQGKGDFDPAQKGLPYDVGVMPSFYTPTPGGTGPILVAKLFENFYQLNKEEIK